MSMGTGAGNAQFEIQQPEFGIGGFGGIARAVTESPSAFSKGGRIRNPELPGFRNPDSFEYGYSAPIPLQMPSSMQMPSMNLQAPEGGIVDPTYLAQLEILNQGGMNQPMGQPMGLLGSGLGPQERGPVAPFLTIPNYRPMAQQFRREEAAAAAAAGGGGGGGDGFGGGGDSGGGSAFGVGDLASTGLGLMAAGENLGKVPLPSSYLAGKAATFAGEKIADTAIDRMSAAERAVAAQPALPGMGTFAAGNGLISTISTKDMEDKYMMDAFGVTSDQINADRASREQPSLTPNVTIGGPIFSPNVVGVPIGDLNTNLTASLGGGGFDFGMPSSQDPTSFDFIGPQEPSGGGGGGFDFGGGGGYDFGSDGYGGYGSDDSPDGAYGSSPGGPSGGDSGGSSKIVCTAMNQAYGFGSFRNRIWLAYAAKNLTKAHEAGYHALFLPLVTAGYKQDKWFSKPLRAVLENIARHRSADLRAEMRGGKRDRVGQAYRFILEPLCYAVGKLKGN